MLKKTVFCKGEKYIVTIYPVYLRGHLEIKIRKPWHIFAQYAYHCNDTGQYVACILDAFTAYEKDLEKQHYEDCCIQEFKEWDGVIG